MIMNHPKAHPYKLRILPPARTYDKWGSGEYGAPRGDHTHNGIDIACYPNSIICAIRPGTVTKLGHPYSPADPHKGHYRYVQVTDDKGNNMRYFYIAPFVSDGQIIETGQPIGISQSFDDVYPGITNHVHFEVKKDGKVIDPTPFLTTELRANP